MQTTSSGTWTFMIALAACLAGIAMAPTLEAKMSGPVGASMALLATLQDADVLPPEGTREANRVIQMVIQFQSVFMKSTDPSVTEFLDEALASKWETRAEEIRARFAREGWTSEVLEALCDRAAAVTGQQRAQLASGFHAYNMTVGDFEWFTNLFRKGRAAFSQRGENIHQVFAQRRRDMPGNGR